MTIAPFSIDQFEVTVAQAAHFLNARGNNKCPGLDHVGTGVIGGSECISLPNDASGYVSRAGQLAARPGFEIVAADSFSYEGAMQYCAWVGKQVPSAAQWEFAARHDPRTNQDYAYPWGDTWKPNHAACNFDGCGKIAAPADGHSYVGAFDGTDGRKDGSSPWGVHDMAGGASELVFECASPNATCVTGEPCDCTPWIKYGNDAIENLRSTERYSLGNSGMQGLRCVLPAK